MDESKGWIKLHRKMLKWEWFKEPATAHLFIYLLLSVNREPTRYKGVEIPAGAMTTSRKALSAATGLSEQQVRTAINHLISTNEITKVSTRKYTLLKVENWNEYQMFNQHSNHQLTNNQPTANQQLTTNKNIRIKEEKKNTPLTPLSQEAEGSGSAKSAGEKLAALTGQELAALTPNPELAEALNAFVQMRAAQRKPLTRYALDLLLAKLNRMASSDAEKLEIVQHSVMNGWQSFVPLQKAAEEHPGLPDWYANTHEDEEPDPDLIQQALEVQAQLEERLQEEEKMYGEK